MNGARYFLQLLAAHGVTRVFGNPGSTEMPLMDALVAAERLRYCLALHEIPALAMADGYTQASRQLSVVSLHASCGTGNAMGMLYNAWCAGTPLLVTAGQQDRRLLAGDPVLAGDLTGVTRPWTKWTHEVRRMADLAPSVRRAVREALTPPTGPVFLSLPVDLQMELTESADCRPATIPSIPSPPVPELETSARVLAAAGRPVIVGGARVTECGASAELEKLAEQLGAPVYSDTRASAGRLPVSPGHPLYAGSLPLWGPEIHDLLDAHDLAVMVGLDFPREYIWFDTGPVPERLRLVQIDVNAREIGKNFPVEAGLVGDIRHVLSELNLLVATAQNWEQARAALERRDRLAQQHEAARTKLRRETDAARETSPSTPAALMGAIARLLPRNAAVVEEAPTTTGNMLARLGAIHDARASFGHRGWALGWGPGAAIGVKLAWPDRPVLAILGDGSALYGLQGLWSAARYQIPVTFVIANNAQYRILKDVSRVMDLEQASQGRFLGCDIDEPRVDYVALSRGFGVEARHTANLDEFSEILGASLSADRPLLIEVPVAD